MMSTEDVDGWFAAWTAGMSPVMVSLSLCPLQQQQQRLRCLSTIVRAHCVPSAPMFYTPMLMCMPPHAMSDVCKPKPAQPLSFANCKLQQKVQALCLC